MEINGLNYIEYILFKILFMVLKIVFKKFFLGVKSFVINFWKDLFIVSCVILIVFELKLFFSVKGVLELLDIWYVLFKIFSELELKEIVMFFVFLYDVL